MKAVILFVTSVLTAYNPDVSAFQKCKIAVERSGKCQWHQGNIVVVSGEHPTRLILDNTTNTGFILHQPGQPLPEEYMPTKAYDIISKGPNTWSANGRYLVCPLTSIDNTNIDAAGEKIGCLAGYNNVKKRRR